MHTHTYIYIYTFIYIHTLHIWLYVCRICCTEFDHAGFNDPTWVQAGRLLVLLWNASGLELCPMYDFLQLGGVVPPSQSADSPVRGDGWFGPSSFMVQCVESKTSIPKISRKTSAFTETFFDSGQRCQCSNHSRDKRCSYTIRSLKDFHTTWGHAARISTEASKPRQRFLSTRGASTLRHVLWSSGSPEQIFPISGAVCCRGSWPRSVACCRQTRDLPTVFLVLLR